MDDQPFAGKYLERRRWIEIAAGALAVGRRAADHLIIEKKKDFDRCRYRVERSLALPCGEPHFEEAFLARQYYGLSELRPNCEICSLRPSSRAGPFNRHEDSESTECQQAIQATCVERVVQ